MTAPRSRKKQLEYLDYLKHDDSTVCSFCIIREGQDQFVEQTKHFKIIKNRFPYSLWDGQTVADHLLVTPLVHRSNLKGMSVEEKAE
jgi:diadenosine tetraphosphate (Ap4A) HIT family hydrolase